MTNNDALDISLEHISKYIDMYSYDDINEILKTLKITLVAIVDGAGNEDCKNNDEDELYERDLQK